MWFLVIHALIQIGRAYDMHLISMDGYNQLEHLQKVVGYVAANMIVYQKSLTYRSEVSFTTKL